MKTSSRSSGYTLIELILVIAIFGMVMTVAYTALVDTLKLEDRVDRESRSGKIGQAILNQIVRDLQGCVYRGYGVEVFIGEERGDADKIDFTSTAKVPAPPDDFIDETSGNASSIGYVTRQGEGDQLILFRRYNWVLDEYAIRGGKWEPVYSRVKSFNISYLDTDFEWVETWDSTERIPEEGYPLIDLPDDGTQDEEDAEEALEELEDDGLELTEDDELPVPIPRAVRIDLEIFIGDEKGLYTDQDGNPIVETYTKIVPLMVLDELELPEDLEDLEAADGGVGNGAGRNNSGNPSLPPGFPSGPGRGR